MGGYVNICRYFFCGEGRGMDDMPDIFFFFFGGGGGGGGACMADIPDIFGGKH